MSRLLLPVPADDMVGAAEARRCLPDTAAAEVPDGNSSGLCCSARRNSSDESEALRPADATLAAAGGDGLREDRPSAWPSASRRRGLGDDPDWPDGGRPKSSVAGVRRSSPCTANITWSASVLMAQCERAAPGLPRRCPTGDSAEE